MNTTGKMEDSFPSENSLGTEHHILNLLSDTVTASSRQQRRHTPQQYSKAKLMLTVDESKVAMCSNLAYTNYLT